MPTGTEYQPEHDSIQLLSVSFYIVAATEAIGGCVLMGLALMGVAMMAGAVQGMPENAAIFLGLVFTVAWGITAFIFWLWCFVEIVVARSLVAHRHYRFCFVWACIELINLPFGTMVGVFAIIVLSRPGVQALFAGVPERDPRLAAFDEIEDEDEDGPVQKLPADKDDGSICGGDPIL